MLPPTGASRFRPLGQRYPTFALLATLFAAGLRRRRRRRYFSRVAADKSDEPGVLGNLPRSRPGHRSDKRGGASRGGASAVAKASSAGSAAKGAPSTRAKAARAKASAKSASSRTTARKAGGDPKPTARPKPPRKPPGRSMPPPLKGPEGPPPVGSKDPLLDAVRLAGKVAEAGLKTAGGLLKRLPRP